MRRATYTFVFIGTVYNNYSCMQMWRALFFGKMTVITTLNKFMYDQRLTNEHVSSAVSTK